MPVFALTNFGSYSFAYAETQYDFLSEFDREYVSGRLGVIKPDPRIYADRRGGLRICRPRRLLFTDDKADNIAAAAAAAGRRISSTARRAGRGVWWRRGPADESGGRAMTIEIIGPEAESASDLGRAGRRRWRPATAWPRAEIADLFLYRGADTLLDRAAWIDGLGALVKVATIVPGNAARASPRSTGS